MHPHTETERLVAFPDADTVLGTHGSLERHLFQFFINQFCVGELVGRFFRRESELQLETQSAPSFLGLFLLVAVDKSLQ